MFLFVCLFVLPSVPGDLSKGNNNRRRTGQEPYCNSDYFSGACLDTDSRCSGWANQGECKRNPLWMLHKCPKSCKVCSGGVSK